MFYDRLLTLCATQNVKVTNLIPVWGISSGNLSKWKAGGSPRSDTLCKIADYFHVSTDYLLGRTDFPAPQSIDFSSQEWRIVHAYRQADERARQVVELTLEPFMGAADSSAPPIPDNVAAAVATAQDYMEMLAQEKKAESSKSAG